ncbi:hypothetical protein MDOR_20010 [Mycolicibacterium doricum]|uniref:Uncharacterized protein n=1 Tax=Mycolicibacterium doricum TaxID=126673 RepID=A0A7I7VT72_9MYCO|nr:hypothetical protein MDOR_20010 [Mycolicibacterium doricum]
MATLGGGGTGDVVVVLVVVVWPAVVEDVGDVDDAKVPSCAGVSAPQPTSATAAAATVSAVAGRRPILPWNRANDTTMSGADATRCQRLPKASESPERRRHQRPSVLSGSYH